jgi:hypothetical protein
MRYFQAFSKAEARTYDYLDIDDKVTGELYGGVDLGKHQSHSALLVVRREANGKWNLLHKKKFELETPYATVIGYMKKLNTNWHIRKWLVDATGVGDYVVEDMKNVGLTVEGMNLTLPAKEEIATNMRQIMKTRQLEIPYDPELIEELNVERFELTREGKVKFSHPENTNDDLFWALALALFAAKEKPEPKGIIIKI